MASTKQRRENEVRHLRRMVQTGGRVERMVKLYVGPGPTDGLLVATNKYWCVNATWLLPLFDHHNLPVAPGTFVVEPTRMTKVSDEHPEVGRFWTIEDHATPLEVAKLGEHPILVRTGSGSLAAVFVTKDGQHVGINSVFADWLSYADAFHSPYTEIRFVADDTRPAAESVVVLGRPVRQARGVAYQPGFGPEEASAPPEEKIIGVVMPIRLSI